MNKKKLLSIFTKEWFWYLSLSLATFLLFIFTFRAWKYDYTTYPLTYRNDGVETIKLIKHISENGSHWQKSEQLGFPFGSNLYVDFPTADQFSIILIKGLAKTDINHFQVLNVYVLITYLLTSIAGYWGIRKFRINSLLSFAGALLFSFLPYHHIRAVVGHVFLIQYFTVPITIYFALKLTKKSFSLSKFLNWKNGLLLITMLALIASTGTAYYAFFSIGIWIISAMIGFIWNKNIQSIMGAILFSAITGLIVLFNISPSLIYQYKNGKNLQIQRENLQIEEYGLRLNRVLAPLPQGKPEFIQKIIGPYYKNVTHEHYQFIGLVGVAGFILLITELVKKKAKNETRAISLIVLGIIILASSGGLAFPLSFLISASIRSYGRISIYIAFLCILIFLKFSQEIIKKIKGNKRTLVTVGLFLIITISLIDQIFSFNPHDNFWEIKKRFDSNSEFVSRIEQNAPNANSVFQLPIQKYPEGKGGCLSGTYDHLYPFLHSSNHNWSFGAVAGRDGAKQYEDVEELSTIELINKIKDMGFNAVWIDNRSCIDGWKIQSEISEITNGTLHTSQDFKYIFIDISDYVK